MAKNCAQRKRTGRARNAPKNDGLLNVVNLLPRPPTPGKESQLGPRHIQISSGKCTQKKEENRNRKEMWKKEVKQTRTTRSGRRSFEDLSFSRSLYLVLSLSLSLLPQSNHRYGQARTIEHKQHPETKPKQYQNPSEPLPFGFIVYAV